MKLYGDLFALAFTLLCVGCARYGSTVQQDVSMNHVPPCWAALVEARTAPRWWFWEKSSKAWIVDKDRRCPVEFIPVDSSSPDLIGEALGPLGGLSQHLVVPLK